MTRNIRLYPWFRVFQNLLFWQAVWFLYFQSLLSPAEAILLYAIYDVAVTVLEVPSGYLSDRWGRRRTLVAAALAALAGALLLALGGGFFVFALGQVLLGAAMAFSSGTDSALLYESLAAAGRADEIERHEMRAWRAAFVALAFAAVAGGAMMQLAPALPFLAAAAAFGGMLATTLAFREPPRAAGRLPEGGEAARFGLLIAGFREPVLLWLFVLGLAMYVLSHVPYVFGQPFILAALEARGLAGEAPLASGAVTALMMAISVLASLAAPALRRGLGLMRMLLVAMALQIAVIAALAAWGGAPVIAVLFLRMVPDALSRPFILARIQPLLEDESRATWLSLKSLAGRLAFASTLWLAALAAPEAGAMTHAAMRPVLAAYALAGGVVLLLLVRTGRRLAIAAPGDR